MYYLHLFTHRGAQPYFHTDITWIMFMSFKKAMDLISGSGTTYHYFIHPRFSVMLLLLNIVCVMFLEPLFALFSFNPLNYLTLEVLLQTFS